MDNIEEFASVARRSALGVFAIFNFIGTFATRELEQEVKEADSLDKAWKMLADCISEINDEFFEHFKIEGERVFSSSLSIFFYRNVKITTTKQGREYDAQNFFLSTGPSNSILKSKRHYHKVAFALIMDCLRVKHDVPMIVLESIVAHPRRF